MGWFVQILAIFFAAESYAAELVEITDPVGPLPPSVANEIWPCEYRGKEWITYPAREYPKDADRKGTLKTFRLRLNTTQGEVVGYKKSCMYKVIDSRKNRFEQALENRQIAFGPYHVWRKDGLMVESGSTIDNVLEGKQLQFDDYGKVAREVSYKGGFKDGVEIYSTADGNRCEDKYALNIITHHVCYYGQSSVAWRSEPFVDGLRHGEVIINFPDGRVERSETWQAGKLNGVMKTYFELEGRHFLYTESTFQQGHKVGQTLIWDENGNRMQ